MWFKVEIQSTSAVRTLNHSGDLSVIPQTSIRTLSPVNIALGCQKPCLSKSSAVLCPPRPDVPITAWEKKGGQSECYWVLVKTKLFKKEMWHLMLGVVFNQRVISTLGQRSPRRKCWNTLETVTVPTAKDRPHGCWQSGLPHIPLTCCLPLQRDTTSTVSRFPQAGRGIIQVFRG